MFKKFVSILSTVVKLLAEQWLKWRRSAKSRLRHQFLPELNLLHCKRNHKEEETKQKGGRGEEMFLRRLT